MRALPISGAQAAAALKSFGYVQTNSNGSHRIFTHPISKRIVTVPDHKELQTGMTRRIIHMTGLTVDEFYSHVIR